MIFTVVLYLHVHLSRTSRLQAGLIWLAKQRSIKYYLAIDGNAFYTNTQYQDSYLTSKVQLCVEGRVKLRLYPVFVMPSQCVTGV